MNLMDSLVTPTEPMAESSGSGSASVLYTQQSLNVDQKAQARENIGADAVMESVSVSGTDPTITPTANKIYQCGELTSLTVTDPPNIGSWIVIFSSGATATSTVFPATIHGLEDFAPKTNVRYEINVLDGYAVHRGWAVAANA